MNTTEKIITMLTKHEQFMEGRDYWWQYQKLNDYSFEPTEAGLKKLARNLDLNIPYLRKRIHSFLGS